MVLREFHPEIDNESRKKFIIRSFVILSIWLVLPLIWMIFAIISDWNIYFPLGGILIIIVYFSYIFILDVFSDKKQTYRDSGTGLIVKDFWGNEVEITYTDIMKLSNVRPDLKKQFFGIRAERHRHLSKYPVIIIPGTFYQNLFVVTLKKPLNVHTKSSNYYTEIFYLGDDKERSCYNFLKMKI